jgi:hypothetical protein
MIDVRALTCPTTIAEQLRRGGNTNSDAPVGNDGQVLQPVCYPMPGNAGFDTDNDADDYNTAAYGQGNGITSSSGPP